MGVFPYKKARFYTYICRNMTHFKQSSKLQLPVYQYVYGNKMVSGVCLQTITDYSPFGAALDGRTIQGDGYRYGYQGSEYDNEIKGEGNSYITFFRKLDPRLGRWLSLDPVFQPYQSPYCSMENNPIWFNDVKGDKIKIISDDKKWKREVRKDIRQIKRSVSREERKEIRSLQLSRKKELRIVQIDSAEESGFRKKNATSKIAYMGIPNLEEAQTIVYPGEKNIRYENGVNTYELIQSNLLFILANEFSHAIDWYNNVPISTILMEDEYTHDYNTTLTSNEVNSNIFENKVRAKKKDDLRLVKSHSGEAFPTKEKAALNVEASKIVNDKIRYKKILESYAP